MLQKKRSNTVFLFILILYIVYAGFYIYRTSFLVQGERYFVLFDDAMISMRYAKNLANGYGPIWNPGETPVEGYTNPLWVFFMAAFHLLPIPASKISLAVQISGAFFLLANLLMVRKIALMLSVNPIVSHLAVFLTAFYLPLNNWGLQGMEVSLLALMVTTVTWSVLRNLDAGRFSPWPYIILGVGTWVRIDAAVPALVILFFMIIVDAKHRKSHILWGIGSLLGFLGSQTLARFLYYGNPLMNTYYLKMGGFPLTTRIERGLHVLIEFVQQTNWVLVALPFSILYYRRDSKIFLLLLLVSGQIAYSVYVGGDAWEHKGGSNRYISLAMPLFFTMFSLALEQTYEKISLRKTDSNQRLGRVAVNSGIIVTAIISLLNFNFTLDRRSLEHMLLLRTPNFIEANKEYVRIANAITEFTTEDARIAVVTAGAIPYFSERPAIDLLGKNDPYIAHQDNHLPPKIADIRPGHMKWDYDYAIGKLKPDVVVQLWGNTEAAETYINKYYQTVEVDEMLFSARNQSPNILWEYFEE